MWWGALAFGIQIYCDFSAYTDIAIGSALLFGIRLPENLMPHMPQDSLKISELLCISLSMASRLPVHPIRRSRNGTKVMLFALMTTMLLGGLWHGASWNFVLGAASWNVTHRSSILERFASNKGDF